MDVLSAALRDDYLKLRGLPAQYLDAHYGPGQLTPMMVAAAGGALNALRFLLTSGCRPDVKARDGRTALTMAAQRGQVECVRLLIQHGGDVNARDAAGWTPLMAGVTGTGPGGEVLRVVQLLIDAGADRRLAAYDRQTALTLARVRRRVITAFGRDLQFWWRTSSRNPVRRLLATT